VCVWGGGVFARRAPLFQGADGLGGSALYIDFSAVRLGVIPQHRFWYVQSPSVMSHGITLLCTHMMLLLANPPV